jgi:hypothetical protein
MLHSGLVASTATRARNRELRLDHACGVGLDADGPAMRFSSVTIGMPNNSTTSTGGPCDLSSGITKYTRSHRSQRTTESGVGPVAGPERPWSAIGFSQTQRQVAQTPTTHARRVGRFIARTGIHRTKGRLVTTFPPVPRFESLASMLGMAME